MKIDSQCLYCKCRYRAPERMLGASIECPRCKSFCTILPMTQEQKAAPRVPKPAQTSTPMPVAAEDPPSPDDFLRGIAVVKSGEGAVPDERADRLAMGTDRLFEPLGDRDPLRSLR